jgi:hypothetical protein
MVEIFIFGMMFVNIGLYNKIVVLKFQGDMMMKTSTILRILTYCGVGAILGYGLKWTAIDWQFWFILFVMLSYDIGYAKITGQDIFEIFN